MKPKISVIMSVYNSDKYLAEAIESILNQTFKDFEFIIINDYSNDNSLNIIKKYMKKDKRIVLINNKKNIGLTKSLNKGLKITKGKYIARMDADDISLPNRFKIQYNYLENNKDIFLLGGGAFNINEKGKILTKKTPLTNKNLIKKKLFKRNSMYHPTIMFRDKNFYYREKFIYTQDYDFYLNLLSNNKNISNVPEKLIKYRVNSEAISWTKKAKQKLFEIKAKEFYHQRLKYGKDEYDAFDSNEILNIDVETSTNKIVLESEIKASFKLNDFKRTRDFCKKYFKKHGVINNILIYYLFSFTGKRLFDLIRRIIF